MIFFRVSISFLVAFELLNYFRILRFELDFTWLGLVVTSVGAWAAIEAVNHFFRKKTGRNLPAWTAAAALAFIYLDALGDVFRLYSAFFWYDQFLHLAASLGIAASLFCVFWQLKNAGVFMMGVLGTSLLAACLTAMLGVFYEWEEYFEDSVNGTNRLGDGFDTANDLMLCLLGGLIMMAAVNLFFRFRRTKGAGSS